MLSKYKIIVEYRKCFVTLCLPQQLELHLTFAIVSEEGQSPWINCYNDLACLWFWGKRGSGTSPGDGSITSKLPHHSPVVGPIPVFSPWWTATSCRNPGGPRGSSLESRNLLIVVPVNSLHLSCCGVSLSRTGLLGWGVTFCQRETNAVHNMAPSGQCQM